MVFDILRNNLDKLYLEEVDNDLISIDSSYFDELGGADILEDEALEYSEKERDFNIKVQEAFLVDGISSRRAYKVWDSYPNTNYHCISLMHLINRSKSVILNVYMRSSNMKCFKSDLGFLCRISKKYNVTTLKIFIGSFHLEL